MQALIQNEELLKYIPQRQPFVMVDKLYAINEKKVTSGFTITSNNVFVVDQIFSESGLMENMAQTAALYAGYRAKKLGKPTPIGYIGGIKDLKLNLLPFVNDNIITNVEITNEVMNVQIAHAIVMDEKNSEIASCELRIFLKEDN